MPAPGRPPDDPSEPIEDLQIAIRFEGDCWLLDSGRNFETLAYPSGGGAEIAARTMASRFAQSGRGAYVLVEDRQAVVGTRTYFPCLVSGSIGQGAGRDAG